jgi:hypothetical protein
MQVVMIVQMPTRQSVMTMVAMQNTSQILRDQFWMQNR